MDHWCPLGSKRTTDPFGTHYTDISCQFWCSTVIQISPSFVSLYYLPYQIKLLWMLLRSESNLGRLWLRLFNHQTSKPSWACCKLAELSVILSPYQYLLLLFTYSLYPFTHPLPAQQPKTYLSCFFIFLMEQQLKGIAFNSKNYTIH